MSFYELIKISNTDARYEILYVSICFTRILYTKIFSNNTHDNRSFVFIRI